MFRQFTVYCNDNDEAVKGSFPHAVNIQRMEDLQHILSHAFTNAELTGQYAQPTEGYHLGRTNFKSADCVLLTFDGDPVKPSTVRERMPGAAFCSIGAKHYIFPTGKLTGINDYVGAVARFKTVFPELDTRSWDPLVYVPPCSDMGVEVEPGSVTAIEWFQSDNTKANRKSKGKGKGGGATPKIQPQEEYKNFILSKFANVHIMNGRNEYMASCPCPNHGKGGGDHNPSLHITFAGDKTLLHCKAGCDTKDVLKAAGLEWSDIGSGSRRQLRPAIQELIQQRLRYKDPGGVVSAIYDYVDEAGNYRYSKIRFIKTDGSKITPYRIIDYKAGTVQSMSEEEGKPLVPPELKTLYNLPQTLKAINEGYPIYWVEGEKDVETLREVGLTAVTAGSSNDWQPQFGLFFKGAKVRLLSDNDAPGQKFVEKVERGIAPFAFWTERYPVLSQAESGDVTDWVEAERKAHEDMGDDEFRKYIREKLKAIEQTFTYGTDDKPPVRKYARWVRTGRRKVKTEKDGDLLGAEKDGDIYEITFKGYNYSELARAMCVHVPLITSREPGSEKPRYLRYEGGVFKTVNTDIVRAEVGKFLERGTDTPNGLDNTRKLWLTKERVMVAPERLDAQPRYINVLNGVYDIETRQLLPHAPEYLFTRQLDVTYSKAAPEPTEFLAFMNTMCTDPASGTVDASKLAVLQEVIGLICSNISTVDIGFKKCLDLYSPNGNTGKTTLLEVLIAIIGVEHCATLQVQSLNQKEKFNVGQLEGKRLYVDMDMSANPIEDSSIFKKMTGGDSFQIDVKNQQPHSMTFTGVCVLLGNFMPLFADDRGGHMFERLYIVPLTNTIPEDKRDGGLKGRLIAERDGIFKWGLEGLERLKANGYRLTECEAAKEALKECRAKSDPVFRFLDDYGYEITQSWEDMEHAPRLYKQYGVWCARAKEKTMLYKDFKFHLASIGLVYAPKGKGALRNNPVFKKLKRVTGGEAFEQVAESMTPYRQLEIEKGGEREGGAIDWDTPM